MAFKVVMPKLSDTMEEGKVLKWVKKEGDRVEEGEVLAEVETDKANVEMEAFGSGILTKILVKEGEKVPVGHLIAVIAEEGEDITALLTEATATSPARSSQASPMAVETSVVQGALPAAAGKVKASPLARKVAERQGLDLRAVKGTGPGGRIIMRDIEAVRSAPPPSAAAMREPSPVASGPEVEERPLTAMRKVIAARMASSKGPVPHFYLTVEVDMARASDLRESINKKGEGVKVSFTDIIVKACAQVLRAHPEVNASFQGDRIRVFRRIHIGVAVALPEGLITPIIRDCDQKGFMQIAREAKELAERARARRLKPDEYQGATFTISNLGMYGIEEFSAIINPPEGAILAVGAIVEKPVVVKGVIGVGQRMRLTLSCDHRVMDGAMGARFLHDLQVLLEDPIQLML